MVADVKRIGLAGGILWGVIMFLTTLLSIWTGYGKSMLEMFASIYPGYSISVLGAFVGAVYGFVDLFIMAYVFAWLYNKLGKK